MKTILVLIFVLISSAAFGDFIVYDDSGHISQRHSFRPNMSDGRKVIEYNGEWSDTYFYSKKLVNGQLVDDPSYQPPTTPTDYSDAGVLAAATAAGAAAGAAAAQIALRKREEDKVNP